MLISSYIYKVSDFRPCIFPSFLFSFLFFEQDGYEVKVALVSNRFEYVLEEIVFLDGIQLKTQNTTFKLSQMTKQLFNIGITISIRLTSSMEEDFSYK